MCQEPALLVSFSFRRRLLPRLDFPACLDVTIHRHVPTKQVLSKPLHPHLLDALCLHVKHVIASHVRLDRWNGHLPTSLVPLAHQVAMLCLDRVVQGFAVGSVLVVCLWTVPTVWAIKVGRIVIGIYRMLVVITIFYLSNNSLPFARIQLILVSTNLRVCATVQIVLIELLLVVWSRCQLRYLEASSDFTLVSWCFVLRLNGWELGRRLVWFVWNLIVNTCAEGVRVLWLLLHAEYALASVVNSRWLG